MHIIHIAFIAHHDARDKNASSGAPYFISQALARHIGQIDILRIDPLTSILIKGLRKGFSAINRVLLFLFRIQYYRHNLLIARIYGFAYSRLLRNKRYDLIFAIKASNEIAFLKTKTPIVYCSDATFAAMVDYYPEFKRLCGLSLIEGNAIEARALKNAALCTFYSRWAAHSAIKDYHTERDKVITILTGANLDTNLLPTQENLQNKTAAQSIELLFIGVDWERKGGNIAYQTMRNLNKRGYPTKLTICGCAIPDLVAQDSRVWHIPYLNKNDPMQAAEFYGLYKKADWFILPTRAKCLGTVFLEAAGFGLPSLAPDTGGIADAVIDGQTGYLMGLEDGGEAYADKIITSMNDGSQLKLKLKTRAFYDAHFNWDTWARELNAQLSAHGLPHQEELLEAVC